MRVIVLTMTAALAALISFWAGPSIAAEDDRANPAASGMQTAEEQPATVSPFSSSPQQLQEPGKTDPAGLVLLPQQIAQVQSRLAQACGKTTEHITLKSLLLKMTANSAMPSMGEQLVYLAEIENIADRQIQCNFIILKAFDASGGLVDVFYLGGGQFSANETKKKSGLFPIRPDCVDRLFSVTIESRCRAREQL